MSRSRQILLPMLAVGGLFVGACGADGSEPFGASADTSAPSATDAPEDTDAPADTDAPVATDAPVDTDAPVATDAPVDTTASSRGDGSDFCNFVERTQDTDALLEAVTGDPAELEVAMKELRDRVNELRDLAPNEIADDVDVFADAILMLVEAFEDAEFNILDADLAFLEDAQLDEIITAATERIDDFSSDRCGLELGVSDDEPSTAEPVDEDGSDDDFSLDGGTIREQFIDQFVQLGFTVDEATCLAEKIDVTNQNILEGDPAEVLSLFEECDISLSRLAEIGG